LVVRDSQGVVRYFTLVKATALTVVPGLIGAYANAFFRLEQSELPEFVGAIASLRSDDDYRRLGDRFMVRRTDPKFWGFSDLLQAAEARMGQADRGLLDFNRLDNR
jgi:hypothetical protein